MTHEFWRLSHTSAAVQAPQPGKVSLTALRPLLLSAQPIEWAVWRKLRAGLGLRGSLISGQEGALAACGVEWRAALRARARRLHPHRAHRASVPLQTTTHLTGSPHGSADPIY